MLSLNIQCRSTGFVEQWHPLFMVVVRAWPNWPSTGFVERKKKLNKFSKKFRFHLIFKEKKLNKIVLSFDR
ncbi:hypothetical protein JHK86_006262 [Glycine max]|nr:hypothetical protein JHK86_006262 [Glycine max]